MVFYFFQKTGFELHANYLVGDNQHEISNPMFIEKYLRGLDTLDKKFVFFLPFCTGVITFVTSCLLSCPLISF